MSISDRVELGRQIAALEMEIEKYQQAIYDAEGALDSAEKELKGLLAMMDSDSFKLDENEKDSLISTVHTC